MQSDPVSFGEDAGPTRWRFVLVGLAATVLFLGSASLVRRIANPLPSDGVSWRESSAGLEARIVVAASEVQPGDRLITIDGQPVRSRLDLLLVDRLGVVGETRAYELVRAGQVVSVRGRLLGGGAPASYLLLALIGLMSVAAALRTGLHRCAGPGAGLVAGAALAYGAFALASPTGWLDSADRLVIAFDELGRLAFPPLLLHAVLVIGGLRLASWAAVLYAPSLLLAGGDLFSVILAPRLSAEVTVGSALFLDRAGSLHFALFLAAAAAFSVREMLRATGAGKEQARQLALATGIGVGPYALLYALPHTFALRAATLADLSLLPMGLTPIALAGLFPGTRIQLSDFASSSTTLRIGLFVGLGLALATAAVLSSAGVPPLVAYTAVVLLLVLAARTQVRVRLLGLVQSLVDRERFEARRTLVAFGRDLAVDPRIASLSRALFERLERAFGIAVAALYVVREDGEALERVQVSQGATGLPGVLPLPASLAAMPAVATMDRIGDDRFSGLCPPALTHCAALRSRGRVIGLLLLGSPDPGRLGRSDRRLLADLTGYVAVAVENARLYAAVVRQGDVIREQESFLRGVLESLALGVVIIDLDGRVLSSNQAFRDLLGGNGIEPGVAAMRVLPPELLDPPAEGNCVRRLADGRALSLAASLLRRHDGSVQGRILVVEDVSERLAEEMERVRREKLASVGLLAAGIAHEVNTPLTGVASYVQMLLQSTEAEDPRRVLLEKVERQSFRAARMVRSLLDFARSGDEPEALLDLNQVATEACSLLEHETRRARVRVEMALDPRLPPVFGRAGQLEQVILNLLKNAVDAMADRTGAIALSSEARGDRVLLVVQDDGCGVSAANSKRIFDPFFTTKRRGEGHGLGLAVSYDIVRRHGGEIRLESREGQGTRVEVDLVAMTDHQVAPGGSGVKRSSP